MAGSYLETYWKTVVETIQDGVMIVDRQGAILSANKAFLGMTGYDREEVIGQPCTIINCSYCEIARGKGVDDWCVLFRTGRLDNHRCTLISKSGEVIHVLKNGRLLHDDEGGVIGSVETITNISTLVEQMNKIDTEGIQPMAHPQDIKLRLRDDEVKEVNKRDQFQAIAPAVNQGLYLVPKVID